MASGYTNPRLWHKMGMNTQHAPVFDDQLDAVYAANYEARTTFRGVRIIMSPCFESYPAWFKGRLLYRLTLDPMNANDDHSEGEYVFAGYVVYWCIETIGGERCLQVYMADDY